MNAMTKIDMSDVMRLTRAGRLQEATALLQGGLGAAPDVAPGVASPPAHESPVLDLRQPDLAGGAWSIADAPAPAAGGDARFTRHTTRCAAGTLAYKLYTPAAARPGQGLLVMLHGCTQTPDDFAAGTRMNALADAHGFLVAYPEQARAANASRCWNWFKAGNQARDRGEPALVAAVTREIVAAHAIDPAKIFVAGLSAGGAAAAVLGCAYPDLYAGIGVHSGLACGAAADLPSALAAMRDGGRSAGPRSRVRTIVFHGSADRTVHARNATAVAEQAGAASGTATPGRCADGTRYTRTLHRDSAGVVTGETWLIDGAGHAWSGGSPAGSYTDRRGPDASKEMLRFFGVVGE